MRNLQRHILMSGLLMLSLFLGRLVYAAQLNIANLLNWQETPTLVSDANLGNRPAIARAPNGDLMIIYSNWNDLKGAQSDPFYVLSQDDGLTWSTPAEVSHPRQDGNTPTDADVVFDQNSTAHALWVEEGGGANPFLFSVHYAQRQAQDGSSWIVARTLFEDEIPEVMRQARIAVGSDGSSLHAVWALTTFAEGSTVQYATSNNGGSTWTQSNIFEFNEITGIPSSAVIATDVDGDIHVAWEQELGGGSVSIYYALLNSGSSEWSTPIEISIDNIEGQKLFEKPDITISDDSVNVVYTFRDPTERTNQLVYIGQCTLSTNCANNANWQNTDASGQFFRVASDALFNVVASVTAGDGIIHAFYHGFPKAEQSQDEGIWSVNDCNDTSWTNVNPDKVTTGNNRVINPSIIFENNKLYLAYQQIENAQSTIYYTSSDFTCGEEGPPTIYLPLIFTN